MLRHALGLAAIQGLAACGAEHVPSPASPPDVAPGAAAANPAASGGPIAETPKTEARGPVRQLAAGDYHTCSLMTDATVRCWGRNKEGQLGDGTTTDRASPVAVNGLSSVTALALGANFSCALLDDGGVRCWGKGGVPGATGGLTKPTPVSKVTGATQIDAGGLLVCARLASSKVVCWGSDPVRTPIDSGAAEVSAAEAHACARMTDGTARCWGDTPWTAGKAGGPSLASPVLPGSAAQITTGDSVACVRIVGSGAVACWGRNEQGELGSAPDMELHDRPVTIPGVKGAVQLVAGEAHLCGVLGDASVRCWGSNSDGELGRGSRSPTEPPGAVSGLSGVVEVALGADHACARTYDGTVRCWGSNANGQLGDGTRDARTAPTPVAW